MSSASNRGAPPPAPAVPVGRGCRRAGPSPAPLALVALGSNLGDSPRLIVAAMDRLEAFSAREVLRSSLWRSRPVDCPPGSPDFINAAAGLFPADTETPESLLEKLLALETEFGRSPKTIINEARPLDADLIAYGQETRNTVRLTLPHPRAHTRRFVLEPLAEIAPGFVLPGRRQTIAEILRALPAGGLERIAG